MNILDIALALLIATPALMVIGFVIIVVIVLINDLNDR